MQECELCDGASTERSDDLADRKRIWMRSHKHRGPIRVELDKILHPALNKVPKRVPVGLKDGKESWRWSENISLVEVHAHNIIQALTQGEEVDECANEHAALDCATAAKLA